MASVKFQVGPIWSPASNGQRKWWIYVRLQSDLSLHDMNLETVSNSDTKDETFLSLGRVVLQVPGEENTFPATVMEDTATKKASASSTS